MLLSIVTINYNKPEMTSYCIDSLYSKYKDEFEEDIMEIIVVDSGSEPAQVGLLKKLLKDKIYKNIILVESKENIGFSKGCNLGAGKAESDLILFLNNDTIVKDRRLIDMASFLNNGEDVSILGGKMLNADGTGQVSCGKFFTPFQASLFILGGERMGTTGNCPQKISKVDWVKGGLMMVKRSVFKSLNGFDENIFMYMEDMEFCYRANKKGYKTYFYPDISIIHKDQGSSSRSFAIINIYKNLLYFYKKHRSSAEYLFLKYLLKIKAWSLIIAGKIINDPYLTKTYEKALAVTR